MGNQSLLKILYVAHIKEPLGHLTLSLMEMGDEIYFFSSKQVLLIIQLGCPASTCALYSCPNYFRIIFCAA